MKKTRFANRKGLSLLLSVCLALGCMAVFVPTASAATVVTYDFKGAGDVRTLEDYGDRGWAYVDDKITSGIPNPLMSIDGCLQILSAEGDWLALKVNITEARRYNVRLDALRKANVGVMDVYMLPLSTEVVADIEGCFTTDNLLGRHDFYKAGEWGNDDIETVQLNRIDVEEPGEYLIVFKMHSKSPVNTTYMLPVSLTLDSTNLYMTGEVAEKKFGRSGDTNVDVRTLTAYGDRGWAYVDDKITSGLASPLMSISGCAQILSAEGDWLALKVNITETGSCDVWLSALRKANVGVMDVYMLPLTPTALTDIEGCLTPDNLLGRHDFYKAGEWDNTDVKTVQLKSIAVEEPGEFLVVLKMQSKSPADTTYMLPVSLTLDTTSLESITFSAGEGTLTMGENAASSILSVNESGKHADLSTAEITYDSTSQSIVRISQDGVLTAVAPGTAFVTATVTLDGVQKMDTKTVSVTAAAVNAPGTGQVLIKTSDNVLASSALTATVNGEAFEGDIGSPESLGLGNLVEMTAQNTVDGKTFHYWKDSANRVISTEHTYSFKVGANASFTAVYCPSDADGTVLVEFFDKNGKVLQSNTLAKGSTITAPANPFSVGYVFTGWSNGYTTDMEVTKNISFVALYNKEDTDYIVLVNGGTGGGTFKYNSPVTVTADAGTDTFAYWERNGKIVSYDRVYSFYVWGDTTLSAVTKAAADIVTKVPSIVMDVPKVSGGRVIFCAERTVPAEYELIETGILISTAPDPTLETAGTIKAVAQATRQNGQFTARLDDVETGTTGYARAYLLYKDGSTYKVIYSDAVFGTI